MRQTISVLAAIALAVSASAQPPASVDPAVQRVLDRAVAYIGDSALRTPAEAFRINYRGTTQRYALYQDREPDVARGSNRFEVLLFDVANKRFALREESTQTDGTQSMWRDVMKEDGGTSLNLKTRRQWTRDASAAAARMATQAWRIPHLVLQELHRDPASLKVGEPRSIGGRRYQVLIKDVNRVPIRILFDEESGAFMGQEFEAQLMDGTHTQRVLFKPYVAHKTLGRFPGGFVHSIGDRVYRDMDAYDVRLGPILENWFDAPTDVTTPRITATPPSQEEIAPGVTLLRNVSGYNAAVADLGDCLAVLDAPEQFAWDVTLPPASDPGGIGKRLVARVREISSKPICYVIPTHHHADHFGGVRALLGEGARVLTTRGNVPLLRRIMADVLGPNAKIDDRIEVVQGRHVLGSGDRRIEIYEITGDPHTAETLFFYFPSTKNVFEGDIADYQQSSKHFLNFIEAKGLEVDKVFSVHNSRFTNPANMIYDEPSN